jgi:sugar O-acyltransferase (sialic acid O-acetyltransferase NeuD family)
MRYLVIGAAGHAQEVAWSLAEQARARGEDADLVFFDDRLPPGPVACGLGAIVGDLETVERYARDSRARLVMGIGLPRTKQVVARRLEPLGIDWATVVHPRATIGPNVRLGLGSYVAAGAILTVNVRVGSFATVNMHAQVAHDGVLGEFVTLHPDAHLAGRVAIGEGCELGTGSIVLPGLTIGPWAVLGAGCVTPASLDGGKVYVGVPATELRARAARGHRGTRIPERAHLVSGGTR